MAIEKDIAITCGNTSCSGAKGIGQLLDYIRDNHHDGSKVKNMIDYAKNSEKTTVSREAEQYLMGRYLNKEMLVTSLSRGKECRELDEIDFMEDKDRYEQYKAGDRRGMGRVDKGKAKVRDAYHVIQSFPGKEHGMDLDPRVAHQIGVEYAKRAFPGYKVVVTTHLNTDHVHNHIAVCAYNEDGRHKLNFDSAFRRKIRKINDDLCMEYNIPVLEEEKAYHHKQGVLHEEKLIRDRGRMSMKDIVRNDIKQAMIELGTGISMFDDLVRYMEQNMNYEIRQTDKHVTYIKKDLLMSNGKPFRCRDTTLGDGYTRRHISEQLHLSSWEGIDENGDRKTEAQEYLPEKDKRIRKYLDERIPSGRYEEFTIRDKYDDRLSWPLAVRKYDANGRRRSLLERFIRGAIVVLRHIIRLVMNKKTNTGITLTAGFDPERKIKELSDALVQVKKYGIENVDELREKQSQLLHELGMMRSEAYPVSAGQKQILYKLLHEDGQPYVLKCKYDELSFEAADRVIRFLGGANITKPEVLASFEEQKVEKMERLYRKIFDNIERSKKSDKLSVSITRSLIEQLTPLVENVGVKIDLTTLTQGQGYGILQHFKSIPLTDDKTISKAQAKAVDQKLKDKGYKLNKPSVYLLRSEYDELRKYLDTGKGKVPDCLKALKSISYSTRMQVEDCLKLTGKSLVIPIEYVDEAQAKILVSDLLYHKFIPEALRNHLRGNENFIPYLHSSKDSMKPEKPSEARIKELQADLDNIQKICEAVETAKSIRNANISDFIHIAPRYKIRIWSLEDYCSKPVSEQRAMTNGLINEGVFSASDFDELSVRLKMVTESEDPCIYSGYYDCIREISIYRDDKIPDLEEILRPMEIAEMINEDGIIERVVGMTKSGIDDILPEEFCDTEANREIEKENEQYKDTLLTQYRLRFTKLCHDDDNWEIDESHWQNIGYNHGLGH